MHAIKIEDEGRMKIEISGKEVEIDVDFASDLLKDAVSEDEESLKVMEKVKATLMSLGFPSDLSANAYGRIATSIWDRSKELQKKEQATRSSENADGSQDTTASTHSD